MSEVKAVKLVSGEELVVEVTNQTETELTFQNPVACVLQRSQNGQPALGFMPWMQSSNGPYTVDVNKVMILADVADEVKNGYNQIFGAGIVVPPKDLILG